MRDDPALGSNVSTAKMPRRASTRSKLRPNRTGRHDESLLQSLVDMVESSTCVVDRDGDIVATNRAWQQAFLGDTSSRLPVDGPYLDVWRTATGPQRAVAQKISAELQRLLGGESDKFSVDYAFTSGDRERWISLRVAALPEISGAVLSHVDITAAKVLARAMSYQSLHDPLTELPNRDLLRDRLLQALAWAERTGRPVVVAFLSLDAFGRVNERLGHGAGDELLRKVSARWLGLPVMSSSPYGPRSTLSGKGRPWCMGCSRPSNPPSP
jgi:GGDEF domain-containing protein